MSSSDYEEHAAQNEQAKHAVGVHSELQPSSLRKRRCSGTFGRLRNRETEQQRLSGSLSDPHDRSNRKRKRYTSPVEGDRVHVLWHVDKLYYLGTVRQDIKGVKKMFYDIEYSPEWSEYFVDLTTRRWHYEGTEDIRGTFDEPVQDREQLPAEGDRLSIKWHVDEKYYEGVIGSKFEEMGTTFFDVFYDKGDREFFLDLTMREWHPSSSKRDATVAAKSIESDDADTDQEDVYRRARVRNTAMPENPEQKRLFLKPVTNFQPSHRARRNNQLSASIEKRKARNTQNEEVCLDQASHEYEMEDNNSDSVGGLLKTEAEKIIVEAVRQGKEWAKKISRVLEGPVSQLEHEVAHLKDLHFRDQGLYEDWMKKAEEHAKDAAEEEREFALQEFHAFSLKVKETAKKMLDASERRELETQHLMKTLKEAVEKNQERVDRTMKIFQSLIESDGNQDEDQEDAIDTTSQLAGIVSEVESLEREVKNMQAREKKLLRETRRMQKKAKRMEEENDMKNSKPSSS